jgi:hypothetical protein
MKPASAKATPGHHRCLYLSATGRKCRIWVLDPRAMFCHRHFEAQPHGPDDFAFHLLNRSCNFENADGIHDSVRRLYTLLAAGLISPRRAAVLGYLTSLLLRTLPAVYNDPFPEAGTPLSAAQLAEREKAKSLPPPASPPAATAPLQKRKLVKKAALAPGPVPAQRPVHTQKSAPQPSATPTPQSHPPADPAPRTTTASSPEHLGNGPGRPMPATRAEFAAQVLKSLASSPSTTTKPHPSAVTPAAIIPTEKELTSPLKLPLATSTSKETDERVSEPSSVPVNQSTNKKSYQARLHTNINWPITGSPPPWGWTSDP